MLSERSPERTKTVQAKLFGDLDDHRLRNLCLGCDDLEQGSVVDQMPYDDSEWFTALRPMLTTIRQPVEAFADQAWSMLMARLNNDRSPKLRAEVHCSLVIRESTVRNEAEEVVQNPPLEIISGGTPLAPPGLTESQVHGRKVFFGKRSLTFGWRNGFLERVQA